MLYTVMLSDAAKDVEANSKGDPMTSTILAILIILSTFGPF